jgi:hydrogenase maturation protein HypF
VGLSGGVFVNRVLLAVTSEALARRGLEVLTHRRVPANDGGLSLGQVAVGARTLETVPTPGP